MLTPMPLYESSFAYTMIFASIIVLLPLIPAIILFKLFPTSTANANGQPPSPWGQIKFKVGGAFAGYLIVFLAFYASVMGINASQETIHERVWTIDGDVKVVRSDGTDHPNQRALIKKIRLVEPNPIPVEDEKIKIKLPMINDRIPYIKLDIPDFGDGSIKSINLNTPEAKGKLVDISTNYRTITIRKPITIQEVSLGGNVRPTKSQHDLVLTESSDRP